MLRRCRPGSACTPSPRNRAAPPRPPCPRDGNLYPPSRFLSYHADAKTPAPQTFSHFDNSAPPVATEVAAKPAELLQRVTAPPRIVIASRDRRGKAGNGEATGGPGHTAQIEGGLRGHESSSTTREHNPRGELELFSPCTLCSVHLRLTLSLFLGRGSSLGAFERSGSCKPLVPGRRDVSVFFHRETAAAALPTASSSRTAGGTSPNPTPVFWQRRRRSPPRTREPPSRRAFREEPIAVTMPV